MEDNGIKTTKAPEIELTNMQNSRKNKFTWKNASLS